MQKTFLRIFIGLFIFGIIIYSMNSCNSSPSTSARTYLFVYEMDDIIQTISYSCSDSEAFSWSRYWVTENFGRYSITYEDDSIGLLSGVLVTGGLNRSLDFSFEISLNNNNAIIKLSKIFSKSTIYTSQSAHNSWVESYIHEKVNSFKTLIQSK